MISCPIIDGSDSWASEIAINSRHLCKIVLTVSSLVDQKENCRKPGRGGGGSSIRRYLVGRSQQLHSYAYLPGRNT